MSEAKLEKLVIYPQSCTEDASLIYGTQHALQNLVATINNVLADNKNLNTHIGTVSTAQFKIDNNAYQLNVIICKDEFINTLSPPFFDVDETETKPADDVPLPAFVKLYRDICAMNKTWTHTPTLFRASQIIHAYTLNKVRNRVTMDMLLTAMRKQPSWNQDPEAYFAMTKAINAVIDLTHPDTLVLRSELDSAKDRIVELEMEVADLKEELLPV